MPALAPLPQAAQELLPWILEHRRHLHRHPELSFHERETSGYLRRQVEALGLKPSAGVQGNYGFFVDLVAPRNPSQFIVLRADMDALPIQEETGLAFSSETPGVGHLCGHDAHSSMLLGALKLLLARREELPYSVRFVFQHAEEFPPGGAVDFIAAGALKDVKHCFGLHVSPRLPVGTFGIRAGAQMAGATVVAIKVRGKGGHAASPHENTDPVLAACAVVVALQSVVARRIDPVDPVVLSICSIHAGDAHNVTPELVELKGTSRAYSAATLRKMTGLIKEVANGVAAAHLCTAEVDVDEGYPPVVNDEGAVGMIRRAAETVVGKDGLIEIPPVMGGEDFAYFCQERPSAFGYIGVANPGEAYYPLHHPKFHPAEDALWRGTAILAQVPFFIA